MFNFFKGVISPKVTSTKEASTKKRTISAAGLALIKNEEKCVLTAYMPTKNDKPTIGYGHTAGVKMGDTITQAEAELFLLQDLEWAEAAINSLVKVPLTQNQFDALVSLVFNIGIGNFSESSLLRELNSGNYDVAASKFAQWNKQRSKTTGKLVELKGLTKRRAKEAALFNT